jgi:hypothetical protein
MLYKEEADMDNNMEETNDIDRIWPNDNHKSIFSEKHISDIKLKEFDEDLRE